MSYDWLTNRLSGGCRDLSELLKPWVPHLFVGYIENKNVEKYEEKKSCRYLYENLLR